MIPYWLAVTILIVVGVGCCFSIITMLILARGRK